jgi:hypothetical protein
MLNREQASAVAKRIQDRKDAATPVSVEKFNTLLADAKALAEFVEGKENA